MEKWTNDQCAAFGRRLQEARKAKGLKQADVAALEGLGAKNKGTVSAWETGRHMPNIMQVAMMADEYGVTVDWLLDGDASWPFGLEAPQAAVSALPPNLKAQAIGMLKFLIAEAQASNRPFEKQRRAAA